MSGSSHFRSTGLLVLLVVVTFLLGFQIATATPRAMASPTVPVWLKSTLQFLRFEQKTPGVEIEQKDMGVLYEVFDAISDDYINADIDPQKVVYGAAMGAVASLGDEYSRFIPPDPANELQNEIQGIYSGVGISIEEQQGHTVIVNVFEGGPAYEAGILTGDVIASVDGQDVLDAGSMKAVELIRGEKGTSVEIGILRSGSDEQQLFTMMRDDIKYPSVWESRMLGGGIGYVEVTQFNKETTADLKAALEDLKKQDLKGLILDLRNNVGGPLDAAVYVSDIFVSKGDMVYLLDRNGKLHADPVDPSGKDNGDALGLPLVVLINQYSASASEIVAGAIQDYGVGTIMGQKSFGKGVVQNVIKLSDGSNLVLTTNKYLTPKERDINEVGIEPDVEISLETKDIDDKTISSLLTELESLSDQYKAKNEELTEYLRDHDYQLEIARKYLAGELAAG